MNVSRLVSIVIPAYKATHFEEALLSAMRQDHDDMEIVICDDCPSDAIRIIVETLRPQSPCPVRYFKNHSALGEVLNVARGVEESRGEYVKFLYDDDLLETDCVSSLLAVLEGSPDIRLATSARRLIDERGGFLPDNLLTVFPFGGDVVIHGPELAAFISELPVTFMGEPSAVMVRREDVLSFGPEIMSLQGKLIDWLGDITLYVKLPRLGDMAMLRRPLSRFRITDMQASSTVRDAPQLGLEGHENLRRITAELGWKRDYERNGHVKVAPLNDREKRFEYDLRAFYWQKSPDQIQQDTVKRWLKERLPTPAQGMFVQRYFSDGHVMPALAFVIRAFQGQAQQLEETLTNLQFSTKGWMSPRVFVLYDENDSAGSQASGLPITWIAVSPGNSAPQLNQLLEDRSFDWFLILDAGAKVDAATLLKCAITLTEHPTAHALFGDEIIETGADKSDVMLRTDFNLDYLLSCPSAASKHWIINRDSAINVGKFDAQYPQALEFDLILRLIEHAGLEGFEHVAGPLVSYAAGQVLHSVDEVRSLERHLQVRGYEQGSVHLLAHGCYRLNYGQTRTPKVSIIVVAHDEIEALQRCVESVLEKTAFSNYEIIIVDNASQTPQAQDWMAGVEAMQLEQVRAVRLAHRVNESVAINGAVQHATGEYLVMLSHDTAVLQVDWLERLLNHGMRPEVGVVGAKLLAPDGTVQDSGVVLGREIIATQLFLGQSSASPGYMYRLLVDQNYSAVSGACLMISRSLFEAVGGLDEGYFSDRYSAIDLCLKARESGQLIVWTPHAFLLKDCGAAKPALPDDEDKEGELREQETAKFYKRWMDYVVHDAFDNINFCAKGQSLQLDIRADRSSRLLSWRPAPLVVAYPQADGDAYRRLVPPLKKLGDILRIEPVCTEDRLTIAEMVRVSPQAVVVQHSWDAQVVGDLTAIGRYTNAMKIYDLSPLTVQPGATGSGFSPRDIQSSLRQRLERVDRLIVPNAALAEELSGSHPDIRIIQDRLDDTWLDLAGHEYPYRRPRVGWVGTAEEVNDLLLISDVIKDTARHVDWIIMGPCPEALRPWIRELRSPVEGQLYPGIVASLALDVAVIPVNDGPFSEYKSIRRALELGACGYPVITSDVQSMRVDLLLNRVQNTTAAWVKAINEYVNDGEESKRLGARLKRDIRQRWMLDEPCLQTWQSVLLGH